MDNPEHFRKMDEEERIYAPQELPLDEQERVREDEGEPNVALDVDEPPAPGIVASGGTSSSAEMATPNIGHADHHGAPGDPETQAADPMKPTPPPYPR